MTQYKAIGVKHTAITEGAVYDLTLDGHGGATFDDNDGDNRYMHFDNNIHCERFELVSEGPVRTETVTKRRIVPGVYGRLRVNDEGKVGRVGLWLEGHYLNAEELDSLAMVASQLAEALRDVD